MLTLPLIGLEETTHVNLSTETFEVCLWRGSSDCGFGWHLIVLPVVWPEVHILSLLYCQWKERVWGTSLHVSQGNIRRLKLNLDVFN